MKNVSIIIPVYNAETTIEKCVESIVANNVHDCEIILVEDCSKDNSWKICQQLSIQNDNIIAVQNDVNRGVSYTRNHGLRTANGKYTIFVDSDDWVDTSYIGNLLENMSGDNIMPVCGYVNHDEKINDSTQIYGWDDFEHTKRCEVSTNIKKLYDMCLMQQLWNKAFVTNIIKENEIWFDENISIGEDCRFILEYIQKGNIKELILINKPLYHYIRGKDGALMYKVGYESVEEPLKNMRVLYEIMGMSEAKIEEQLSSDRRKQVELYAYLIYHNAGMSNKEKKRLILELDSKIGRQLYTDNRILYCKERVVILLDKLRGKRNH